MIFVTGGTGLLGSHLLTELVKHHPQITAIYRNKEKIKTVKKCFDFYHAEKANTLFDKITWKECDVLDIPLLDELMKGHKEVYHCAGIVSFRKKDFNEMMEINRYGTANMVNVALENDINKFCFVSSTAAVGRKDLPKDGTVTENGNWVKTDETSGYAISKYSAEKEVWRGINEGLNATIVNPCVLFGAGDWSESSMTIFKTLDKGLKFYSPGSNAFVDARDVANIMIELMQKEIFNDRFLCIGVNTSFKNLFERIAKELHKNPPKWEVSKLLMGVAWRFSSFWSAITFSKSPITKDTARNAFNHVNYSNKKIKKALDYDFYSLEETVKNAVAGRTDQ